jgi:putative phosphoesterase
VLIGVNPSFGFRPEAGCGELIPTTEVKGRMARTLRHTKVTIPLPRRGCRVVVVADTHSKPHSDALALIAAQKPDHILHAGDIGDLGVLDQLETVAPVTAVLGNIDDTSSGLPDVVTIQLEHGGEVRSCWLLTHIAVRGPKLRGPVLEMARLEDAQLVVCGHSHVPLALSDRGVAIFNPGSIGPRRFHLPITFGTIQVSQDGLNLTHISCETGDSWHPPT